MKYLKRIVLHPGTTIDTLHVGYLSTVIMFHEAHVIMAGALCVVMIVEVIYNVVTEA